MTGAAALIAIEILERHGLTPDEITDQLLIIQKENVEALKWGAPILELSDGAFARMCAAGWDVHLADGRWIAWCEEAGGAAEKLAEWRRLFGEK